MDSNVLTVGERTIRPHPPEVPPGESEVPRRDLRRGTHRGCGQSPLSLAIRETEIIAIVESSEKQIVVRPGAPLARRNDSEERVIEALRTDFRRRLPGVRASGIVALVAGLVLFAAAVLSLLAGGSATALIARTLLLGVYSAGALYLAIILLSDADTLDRSLQSGYALEFEALFLVKRRAWQRIAAVGGSVVAISLSAAIILGGSRVARLTLAARQETTTRARMERIVAEAELYAIVRHEYPRSRAEQPGDGWNGRIIYTPQCDHRRCSSFRVASAGPDRRWNTADDIVLRSKVVLK